MLCFDDFHIKDSHYLIPEACRSSAALTVTVTIKKVRLLNLMCYSLSLMSDLFAIFVISDLFSGLYNIYQATCQCINS